MSRRRIKFDACERCPLGREAPATRTVAFALEDTVWKIRVCEPHGRDLERDLWGWGSLGTQVTTQPEALYDQAWREDSRHAAELRSGQSACDREVDRTRVLALAQQYDKARGQHSVERLPDGAGDFFISQLASEQLVEGSLRVVDILWAVGAPTQVRSRDGLEVRIRDGVEVVVDPGNKEILTVGRTRTEGEAHGTRQTG